MQIPKTPAVLFLSLAIAAFAQGPAPRTQPATAPAQIPPAIPRISPADVQGSAISGQASSTELALTLDEAIDRGLKNNLGVLVSDTATRQAHAERIRALSALLPLVGGNISETVQQINLAAFGISAPGIPKIVGPFGITDLRASASEAIFDLTSIKNRRSAIKSEDAAKLSARDARDLVVQAVGSGYLLIIADKARIVATQAQVDTAQALFTRAHDQHVAGVSPAIDELRANVELKTQQQQLIAQRNQLEKDKLALARVIGLPPAQAFDAADAIPYTPLEGMTPDAAIARAIETRADYKSLAMQVKAAEMAREAALAERLPTLNVDANYGDIGTNIGNSHGSFSVTGSVRFNIYTGGRIRADIEQAGAVVKQRKDELADVQGQIDVQVRDALLDLKTAADQVTVARDNLDLANQTLTQARDRFAAGVTDNIEVVQAQESVANANQSLINSIYMHNLAKVQLARAVGGAETSLKQFMGGAPSGSGSRGN